MSKRRTYTRDSLGRFAPTGSTGKTVLYHGTSKKNAKSIIQSGFMTGGGAWFTRNKKEALGFGGSAVRVIVSNNMAKSNRIGERHVYIPRKSLPNLVGKRIQ